MANDKYIDVGYLDKFWNRNKQIPTNSNYMLGDKSQTIKGAIDDLYTNKQAKVGVGSEGQVLTTKKDASGKLSLAWSDVQIPTEEEAEELKSLYGGCITIAALQQLDTTNMEAGTFYSVYNTVSGGVYSGDFTYVGKPITGGTFFRWSGETWIYDYEETKVNFKGMYLYSKQWGANRQSWTADTWTLLYEWSANWAGDTNKGKTGVTFELTTIGSDIHYGYATRFTVDSRDNSEFQYIDCDYLVVQKKSTSSTFFGSDDLEDLSTWARVTYDSSTSTYRLYVRVWKDMNGLAGVDLLFPMWNINEDEFKATIPESKIRKSWSTHQGTQITYINYAKGGSGGAGTVTSVKVGTTEYTPVDGVVTLPEYPTISYPVTKVNNKTGAVTLSGADLAATGYSKPSATSAIAATDTINAALGKLEKALDGKAATSAIPTVPTKVSAFENDANYLTSHQSLANYVTLNTAQTITGQKTMSGADASMVVKRTGTNTNQPCLLYASSSANLGSIGVQLSNSTKKPFFWDTTTTYNIVTSTNATAVGSSTTPVYVDANGVIQSSGKTFNPLVQLASGGKSGATASDWRDVAWFVSTATSSQSHIQVFVVTDTVGYNGNYCGLLNVEVRLDNKSSVSHLSCGTDNANLEGVFKVTYDNSTSKCTIYAKVADIWNGYILTPITPSPFVQGSKTAQAEPTKPSSGLLATSTCYTKDTNTWRGIADNLTSTDGTISLSANQGRILNSKFGSYLPLAGGTMTGQIVSAKATAAATLYGIKLGNGTLSHIVGANDKSSTLHLGAPLRFSESTAWDWNQWAGLSYDHSAKSIYLGLADNVKFTANAAQSGGKLYTPGVSSIYVGNGTTAKEVLTEHQSLANYVTLNTAQTISGQKTFSALDIHTAGVRLGTGTTGATLSYNSTFGGAVITFV